MNHRVIYEDSRVREAWKLFVEKGMLKREVLKDQIAFSWARSKLSGLLENKESIEFYNEAVKNDVKSLGIDFDEWTVENKYQFALLDEKFKVLHTMFIKNLWNMLKIKRGDILDEAICGTLACHLTTQTGMVESVIGYEHYLKCFHRFVDFSIPITLNGLNYYVWLSKDISEFDPEDLIEATNKVKHTCFTIENEHKNEIAIPYSSENRFMVLISKSGEILNNVTYEDVVFEQKKSIFEKTNLTFDKLKLSQIFLVEIELVKDDQREVEDKFVKYFCEVITSFDEYNILLFKKLSTSAELMSLLKGSLVNELTYRLSDSNEIQDTIFNELKEIFSRVAQNSNPVFIYDDSISIRIKIAYLFYNHYHLKHGIFYTIDCSKHSSNEIDELLFSNEKSHKLGVLDWLGEGIVYIDSLTQLEKRIQNKIVQYIESSKSKLNHNLIPRLVFGECSETISRHAFSPLILAYSQFNKIELTSNRKIQLEVSEMNTTIHKVEPLYGTKADEKTTTEPKNLSIDISNGNATRDKLEKSKLFQDNEKALIEKVLYETRYHLTETAKQLGIGRATLYRKIKLYKIKSRSKNNE